MRGRASGSGPALTVLGLALLVAGPVLLGRGFALVGDMVFVPHQPWKDQWLGVDGSVPRAVPVDALVSLATHLVPGDLLQKAVLVAIVAGAGWGMLRLLEGCSTPARLAGAVLACWNPFVYERFAIGQWALLCGYAALPWLVASARRLLDGSGGWAAPTLWLAVAAWTSPTGGVIAAGVLLAVVAARRRLVLPTLALGLLVNLPWLLPGALARGAGSSAAAGVGAFAATSDQPFGTLASVLSFGGMWKTSVAPDLHPSWLYAVLALVLALAGVTGALLARRRPAMTGLAVAALVGLVLALAPTTGPGRDLVTTLVTHVPGAGILRDSQKWIAPYVVWAAAGLGLLVERLTGRVRPGALALVAFVPVLALPTLVWGLSGAWRPAAYPADWGTVAQQISEGGAGRTVVLPWSAYRRFGWAHERAVLDPAFRFLPGEVLTSDDLVISGSLTVPGESVAGRQLDTALAAGRLPATLARLGVRWVVVEKGVPGTAPEVPGQVVHDGPDLRLVRLAGPAAGAAALPGQQRRPLLYAVDTLVVSTIAGVAVGSVLHRRRRTPILPAARSSEG